MELVLTSGYDDAPIEYAPHNGGTGRRSFGQRQAPGMQRSVTGVVGEVEARHFFGGKLMEADEIGGVLGMDGSMVEVEAEAQLSSVESPH